MHHHHDGKGRALKTKRDSLFPTNVRLVFAFAIGIE